MLTTIHKSHLDDVEDLLNESYTYFKKVIWFYGDQICAVCNPKEVLDF